MQKYVLEMLFPELAESEDERIQKVLVGFFKSYKKQGTCGAETFNGLPTDNILAWLEKQGEQKHTPKHKVGDTIYYNSFGKVKSMIVANVTTDSTNNPMYEDENGNAVFEEDLIEQKPAWTPMDEQRVENLLAIIEGHGYPGEVAWLNSLKDRVQPKKEWREEDERILVEMLKIFNIEKFEGYNIGKNNEDALKFLNSLKYRVVSQPKQEWNEEDEKLYNDLSDTYFYNDEDYTEETYKRMLQRVLDWMNKRAKSLRHQNTWKPSLSQLNALGVVAKGNAPDDIEEIKSLYNDLKKLKG